MNLKTAIQDGKECQDFDSQSVVPWEGLFPISANLRKCALKDIYHRDSHHRGEGSPRAPQSYTQVDSKTGKVGMDFTQNFHQALAGAEVVPYSYRAQFQQMERL